MNISFILKLIDTGTALVRSIKEIVNDASSVIKSDDQTLLKGKLAELQSEVRDLSESTGRRLRGD